MIEALQCTVNGRAVEVGIDPRESLADVLRERYRVDVEEGDSGYELLEKAGRKRGFLMRGAQVDTERMARILLDEFRGGKLGRFTLETVEDCGK